MDEITSVFVQESREQLAEMEAGLLRLEQNPEDRDNINGIFRAAHTIKGGAGVVECAFIVSFTHWVENLLDALRNGTIASAQRCAGRTSPAVSHRRHFGGRPFRYGGARCNGWS
jgi:two-component system chemotaxis sensor kinase CheA